MPRPQYINTYAPNTQVGASLAGLAQALFPSRLTQQEQAKLEAEARYINAGIGEREALARKNTLEGDGLELQVGAMRQIDDPYTLAGVLRSNSEQLQKAKKGEMLNEMIANTAVENDPVRQGQQLEFIHALQFADAGKNRFSMNSNNVTLDQLGGKVTNEDNDLNQSAITKNLEAASLDANRSGTEVARQKLYGAQTDKARADVTRQQQPKMTQTFVGYDDVTGAPIYKNVALVEGGEIIKEPPKPAQNKPFPLTSKTQASIGSTIDAIFGFKKDEAGNTVEGVPIDPALKLKIVSKAGQLYQATGNEPLAIEQAIAELTGGQELVTEGDAGNGFTDGFGLWGTDTRKQTLPRMVKPTKPQPKKAQTQRPVNGMMPTTAEEWLKQNGAI